MEENKTEIDIPVGFFELLNSIENGLCITDEQGCFVFVNDAYCAFYGYSRQDFLGQPFTLVVPEDNQKAAMLMHKRFMKEEEEIGGEWLVRRKNGLEVPIIAEAGFLRSQDGKKYKVTTITDLSSVKLANNTLAEVQALYDTALEVSGTVSFSYEVKTDHMVWPKNFYAMFGVDSVQDIPALEAYLSFVHPDEREEISQIFNEFLYNKHVDLGFSHRILHPKKGERYILGYARMLFSRKQIPYKLVVSLQDVTNIEDVENTRVLTTEIFEQSTNAIVVTDTRNLIIDVNRKFTELSGYTKEEALGCNPSLWNSRKHSPSFFQAMWKDIKEKESWQGEIWNRKKCGEIFPCFLSISVIKNKENILTHYIGVLEDLSELEKAEKKIYKLSNYDVLTELPNRNLLYDRLHQKILEVEQTGKKIAVLHLDLHKFKIINETLGHGCGDKLLQKVAQRLLPIFYERDTVARVGSDEFAVILADIDNQDYIALKIEAILDAFRKPVYLDHEEGMINVSVSIGVAIYPNDGKEGATLLRNAETALHTAKEGGPLTFRFFSQNMTERATQRLNWEKELLLAIERNEFVPFYQPKIDAGSGKVVGMEALLRWLHPERGIVSPLDFIPYLEESNLIQIVGKMVLRQACLDVRKLLEHGFSLRVSVNVSPRQLSEIEFTSKIREIIEETQAPGKNLELEITESTFLSEIDKTILFMTSLKQDAVSFSIDDFGTGYSSLSYLTKLPVDVLKIDRAFLEHIPHSKNDSDLITAIIQMAHALGIRVIAEGVETNAHIDFLREKGCDQFQGYYFSKPLPFDEFVEYLKLKEE